MQRSEHCCLVQILQHLIGNPLVPIKLRPRMHDAIPHRVHPAAASLRKRLLDHRDDLLRRLRFDLGGIVTHYQRCAIATRAADLGLHRHTRSSTLSPKHGELDRRGSAIDHEDLHGTSPSRRSYRRDAHQVRTIFIKPTLH